VLDTLVALLVVRLKLLGLTVLAAAAGAAVAVALSTSTVAVTNAGSEEPLLDEAGAAVEAPAEAEGAAADLGPAAPVVEPDVVEPDVVEPDVVEPATPEPPAVQRGPAAADPVELPTCPAKARNHGAYVSSVARDTSVTGQEHGARVSAAARSDCGKGEARGKGRPGRP
jgi:outer membrane biosynthesis protein TonB